jgi:hypothetical protein
MFSAMPAIFSFIICTISNSTALPHLRPSIIPSADIVRLGDVCDWYREAVTSLYSAVLRTLVSNLEVGFEKHDGNEEVMKDGLLYISKGGQVAE